MGNSSSSEEKKGSSSSTQFKGVNGVAFEHQQSNAGSASSSSGGGGGGSSYSAAPPPAAPPSDEGVMSALSTDDILKEAEQLERVISELEAELADARDDLAITIEYNKQRLEELDEDIALKYKEAEREAKDTYRADLKEAAEEKDEELAYRIDLLNSSVFPERVRFVYEDLRSTILVRDLESEWTTRHAKLLALQKQDIDTIRKIAHQEHDKVYKTVMESLDKERQSIIQSSSSKKRGGGLLSFLGFTPSKKSRVEEEEDEAGNASETSDD